MCRQTNAVLFTILALQALISLVKSQTQSPGDIAYAIIQGITVTYGCVGTSVYFSSSTTYDDNSRTFAFCNTIGDYRDVVATSCDGSTLFYTGWDETRANPSGSTTCSTGLVCFTVTIYEFYNEGRGFFPRDFIGCDSEQAWPTYFMEHPTDWTTSPPATPTTGTTAGKDSKNVPSATSKPGTVVAPKQTAEDAVGSTTQSSTTKPGALGDDDGGGGGPSTGTIAGAVVGAVAGVAAITGALIIGFRIGQRRSPLDNQEAGTKQSFRDTISSLPRPTITWTHPGTKNSPNSNAQNTVSVIQTNFPDEVSGAGRKGPVELPSPVSHTPGDQAWDISQPTSTHAHAAARTESPRDEPPTGFEGQGWARSESYPLPYKDDLTQR